MYPTLPGYMQRKLLELLSKINLAKQAGGILRMDIVTAMIMECLIMAMNPERHYGIRDHHFSTCIIFKNSLATEWSMIHSGL